MSKIFIKLVSVYQRSFSPDHGIFSLNIHTGCRFYPSCSQYFVEVLQKEGLIKGASRSFWRILRCNPLARGGVDLS